MSVLATLWSSTKHAIRLAGPPRFAGKVVIYSRHGRHHVAHITSLRERMGWR